MTSKTGIFKKLKSRNAFIYGKNIAAGRPSVKAALCTNPQGK